METAPPSSLAAHAVSHPKVFVQRVNRGQKRWFFNCSIPLELLHVTASYEDVMRTPEAVAYEIAKELDLLFGLRSGSGMPGRLDA